MRKRSLSFFTLLVALLFALPASAQGPVTLDSLKVALWPEFDDPRLLVIIDGALPAGGATVRVPVPAGAVVNAVATLGADGTFLQEPAQTSQDGSGYQIVTLTPANTSFRVEYYQPLSANGDQRQASFDLPSGYLTSNDVSISVLLPPDASNVSSDPAMDSAGTSAAGSPLLQRQIGTLAADTAISQSLSYANPTGALTNSEDARLQATPQTAPAAAATGANAANPAASRQLIVILGAAAAITFIAGGFFWLWRTRSDERATLPPPEGSREASTNTAKPASQQR